MTYKQLIVAYNKCHIRDIGLEVENCNFQQLFVLYVSIYQLSLPLVQFNGLRRPNKQGIILNRLGNLFHTLYVTIKIILRQLARHKGIVLF